MKNKYSFMNLFYLSLFNWFNFTCWAHGLCYRKGYSHGYILYRKYEK